MFDLTIWSFDLCLKATALPYWGLLSEPFQVLDLTIWSFDLSLKVALALSDLPREPVLGFFGLIDLFLKVSLALPRTCAVPGICPLRRLQPLASVFSSTYALKPSPERT